ncbi:MAG: hypothetical protein MPJ24_05875 [Pirellulaceae bacterium]|nr:hypothetical protein [Pirellulaceae bacterium]
METPLFLFDSFLLLANVRFAFFIVVIGLIIALLLSLRRNQAHIAREAFIAMAEKHHGTCLPRKCSLRINPGGNQILIDVNPKQMGNTTQLRLRYSEISHTGSLQLQMSPSSWSVFLKRLDQNDQPISEYPSESLSTSKVQLSEVFEVSVHHHFHANILESSPFIENLKRWQKGFGNALASIKFSNELITLQLSKIVTTIEELELCSELLQELFEIFLASQMEGVHIEIETATPLGSLVCPICRESTQEGIVVCTRCKVPHHKECWEYFGKCSTYACNSDTYFIPPVAVAVADPVDTLSSDPAAPLEEAGSLAVDQEFSEAENSTPEEQSEPNVSLTNIEQSEIVPEPSQDDSGRT